MNETVTLPEFEQRVRDRAYALWENEGRPSGRDAEHWRLSEQATLAELSAAPVKKASKPKAASRKKFAPSKRPASSEAAAALSH